MQQMNEEEIKKFWNRRAELYGKIPTESIVLFKVDESAKERDKNLKDALDAVIQNNLKILELGCSTGRLSLHLAPRSKLVVGVDFSKKLIDIAKQEGKQFKNLIFIENDASTFSYDDTFDVVLVSGLFHYLNDDTLKKTINVIKKHLRVGGIAVVKESIGAIERFAVINKYSTEIRDQYNSIYRTKNELKALFELENMICLTDYKFMQHRTETAIWFFIFRRE